MTAGFVSSVMKNSVSRTKRIVIAFCALLLLVGVLLVLLAGNGITRGPRNGPEGCFAVMRMDLETAFESYCFEHGSVPPSSDNRQLAQCLKLREYQSGTYTIFPFHHQYLNAAGEFVDPWGTPLRFEIKDRYDFEIISAGPDKIFGTADDITNHN